MLSSRALLTTLADGQYHSGEDLARHFGVSRTAIWKQLKQMTDAGIRIDSVRGKGYMLDDAIELLEEASIREQLESNTGLLVQQINCEYVIGSTNAAALALVESSASGGLSGTAIFAEQQTAGRGRRGRVWESPLGRNIYCSLVWEFSGGAAAIQGLSLAIGVVMVELLEELGYLDVELKWPNDLLWRGKKLGGILIEMQGDVDGPSTVVAGIGLNVSMSHLASIEIDQPWVDLAGIAAAQQEAGDGSKQSLMPRAVSGRNRLAAALLNRLVPALADYELETFSSYLERWEQHDAHRGKQVILQQGDERILGDYLGVASNGNVVIATALGEQQYSSGEIRLRDVLVEDDPKGQD